MLRLDGSLGEGGGQILRTALGLSLVTGQAFCLEKIRAGRKKPGLLRQHLTAVEAAAAIGQAEVEGAELGSGQLRFTPRQVMAGDYRFAVGTAGSATLVLQTVLPALAIASGTSQVVLEGGTHNPFAPPFDFLAKTFLPLFSRMGPKVTALLHRPGFFPAGGGRFNVVIQPAARLSGLEILERGEIRRRCGRALVAGLPRMIAEREVAALRRALGWLEREFVVEEMDARCGPGNAVLVELESEQLTEVCSAFGEKGVSAEAVAGRAAEEARRYLASSAPVGEHLADQLLVPLALAGRGSFLTLSLSGHARTNIEIIQRFLEVKIRTEPEPDGTVVVRVGT